MEFFVYVKIAVLQAKRLAKVLCTTCGNKILFVEGTLICKICNSEFDSSDMDENLIPLPVFVVIELISQYAIIDTRKQEIYVHVDTAKKARLISALLNRHVTQATIKKQFSRYLKH
jgi:predicted amidophosphoribosyltransferase